MSAPAISVIVISRNEGAYLRSTLEGLRGTLPSTCEIIVVADGSVDGSADFLDNSYENVRLISARNMGVARARNLGAQQSAGEMVVFADAHVSVPDRWWQPLWEALAASEADAVAPSITALGNESMKGCGLSLTTPDMDAEWLPCCGKEPYAVPVLPGAFLATTRNVFDAAGGFDDGLLSRGGVDNELCMRMWLLGYELRVVPLVEVAHLFRCEAPFTVPWPSLLHNRLRLAFAHLSAKRVRRVVETFREHEHFPAALALTVDSDVFARRSALREQRLHDDDWFFDRFDLRW
ncbi:MAG TPA: glycosyltransferase [Bryobacteraceae bacterium]|nr:glycosyltransferase [Bryobacteraceae bacterium]